MNVASSKSLEIKTGSVTLPGELVFPDHTTGLVIFSHGSGSSRFSPRNNFVAQHLHRIGLGTFLFDLLTREEDNIYSNRFNIDLLSNRLIGVTKFLLTMPEIKTVPIGYFGASTGAASALVAASTLQKEVYAVVSRGGRPDLALHQLQGVEAPTLLIVGELDQEVISLNRAAMKEIRGIKRMEIIKGATHLFEEPGTLERVAALSGDWFIQYFTRKETARS
jgi:pimeloyl-ACP methyl ester carboxylesterase